MAKTLVSNNEGSALCFADDIPSSEKAAKWTLKQMEVDKNKIIKKYTAVKLLVDNLADKSTPFAKTMMISFSTIKFKSLFVFSFRSRMKIQKVFQWNFRLFYQLFLGDVSAMMDKLKSSFATLAETYQGLTTFFGESSKLEFSEFFCTLVTFSKQLLVHQVPILSLVASNTLRAPWCK